MKQIMIAVLLVAAAGAVYYYAGKNKNKNEEKLIVGKWKFRSEADSSRNAASIFSFPDSMNVSAEFTDKGMKLKGADSVLADFSWQLKDSLLIISRDADKFQFNVIRLDSSKIELTDTSRQRVSFHRL